MLRYYHFPTNTGASATLESAYAIHGEILGVIVRAAGGPAGPTLDVTLRTKGEGPPTYNVLVLTNVGDGTTYKSPRDKPVDSSAAAITDAYAPFVVTDKLEVVIAQGDADTEVEAWVIYDTKRADGF